VDLWSKASCWSWRTNPLIRLNAIQIIEDVGHEVVEAANADEAMLILERGADVRIVFTDINMPGSMDGLQLAGAIRNRWPPIQLVVTSGKVMLKPGDLPPNGRFLAKPYSADQS
jgi:CheY-like chemotaxis protein